MNKQLYILGVMSYMENNLVSTDFCQ